MTDATDEIPDYQSLMLPVLKLAAEGEIRIRDAINIIADQLNLSEEARRIQLPSGRQAMFDNRIHWAKFHLSKAGLTENSGHGKYSITDRGREVLANDPDRIDLRSLKQYVEFQSFISRSSSKKQTDKKPGNIIESETQSPEELMHDAHAEIEAALADDLLARVMAEPPAFFERLIIRLLLAMGYGGAVASAGRAIGKSGDDGVDGVIDQDALGLDQVYVQAKRYAAGNNVGADAIRDFSGSLELKRASKGLFITTSDFTANAKDTAERLHKRIVLINGETLARLMIRHNVGCQIEDTLYVRRIDEDFFEN